VAHDRVCRVGTARWAMPAGGMRRPERAKGPAVAAWVAAIHTTVAVDGLLAGCREQVRWVPDLSLGMVEAVIRANWSIETCDPIDVPNWSEDNRASGQCAVTALVVRDLLGGRLLEAEVLRPDGSRQGFHYWNRLPGFDLDLTREQFIEGETVQPPIEVEGPPQVSWVVDTQYARLRQRVFEALGIDQPAD